MIPQARPRRRELGEVPAAERSALRAGFGSVLAAERAALGWTGADLAHRVDAHPSTVRRLESGHRRPTTSMVWRLARALRPRGTIRDRVAVDQRLRAAAGGLLVVSETRPNRRRERVRAELEAAARAAGGPVVGDQSERLGPLVVAELAREFGTWA
ncbi:Helix-turn-helix [Pseudonocardia ammonioxydans]|uniref:Helix-turn-helix n=1 Tax=Pseudonocardia ammonioxydans TaxID=260086 RepID=A0A1I5GGC8_PSUAM|nr:helix-turn-helix transcriptional regulator [Pseudonocardia ammonioxydans]SFO34939.1 Helix-turn-helix [Pseudonocardia ammonioxydans]